MLIYLKSREIKCIKAYLSETNDARILQVDKKEPGWTIQQSKQPAVHNYPLGSGLGTYVLNIIIKYRVYSRAE